MDDARIRLFVDVHPVESWHHRCAIDVALGTMDIGVRMLPTTRINMAHFLHWQRLEFFFTPRLVAASYTNTVITSSEQSAADLRTAGQRNVLITDLVKIPDLGLWDGLIRVSQESALPTPRQLRETIIG